MELITVQQAIAHSIMAYPSLYAGTSYERAKFRMLDQIFNVNGNGHQDPEDFLAHFARNGDNAAGPQMPPEHLVDGSPLFSGYTKTQTFGETLVLPDFDSLVARGVPEEHKSTYPEVVHWEAIEPITAEYPYPNFQENYSTYYTVGEDVRSLFDRGWLEAAQWFYNKCLDYFLAERGDYHYAYPQQNEAKTQRYLTDFTARISKMRTPGMDDEAFNQAVSQAYELPYSGDPDAFLRQRWQVEKVRILAFLDKIQGDIGQQLAQLPEPKAKRPAP